MLTIPNALTFLRFLGIPLFIWLALDQRADGWAIRTAAVQRSIPCITTTAGFSAAVDAITFLQSSPLSIKSLQEWLT